MVSFDSIKLKDNIPIYIQILQHVKRGIVSGEICDGDELPSRRTLSSLLSVNPNTIQRAYKTLEDEGLIESSPGAKSCMRFNGAKKACIRSELLESDIQGIVSELKEMGISKEDALELLSKAWDKQTDAET